MKTFGKLVKSSNIFTEMTLYDLKVKSKMKTVISYHCSLVRKILPRPQNKRTLFILFFILRIDA